MVFNKHHPKQQLETKEVENRPPKQVLVSSFWNLLTVCLGKYQKETEIRAKNGSSFKQGRWSKDEHFRFLEALKLYGKEWRKVQSHVGSRTST